MQVEEDTDETYKGRRYDLDVYVLSGRSPMTQYTCEYLEYDIDGNPIWVPDTRETSSAVRSERRGSADQFPQRECHGRRWPIHQEPVRAPGR